MAFIIHITPCPLIIAHLRQKVNAYQAKSPSNYDEDSREKNSQNYRLIIVKPSVNTVIIVFAVFTPMHNLCHCQHDDNHWRKQ